MGVPPAFSNPFPMTNAAGTAALPGAADAFASSGPGTNLASGGGAAGNRSLLVPSPRFKMQYAIEDAGPDGPAVVELWITQDGGRTWIRRGEDPDRVSPFDVDLGGEGTFGLSLVARSASGLGDQPPARRSPANLGRSRYDAPLGSALPSPDRNRSARRQGGDHLAGQRSSSCPALRFAFMASRPAGIGLAADHRRAGEHGPVHLDRAAQLPRQVSHPGRGDRFRGPSRRCRDHRPAPVIVDRSRPRSRIIGLDPNARAGDGPGARPLR